MIIAIPDDHHGIVTTLECMKHLEGHEVRVYTDAAPPLKRTVEMLEDADIVMPMRERTGFSRELIAALPKLKLISQTGRSTHHVDVAACTERGIAIAAGTHASPYTVAEHTWALILSTPRHIPLRPLRRAEPQRETDQGNARPTSCTSAKRSKTPRRGPQAGR